MTDHLDFFNEFFDVSFFVVVYNVRVTDSVDLGEAGGVLGGSVVLFEGFDEIRYVLAFGSVGSVVFGFGIGFIQFGTGPGGVDLVSRSGYSEFGADANGTDG